MKKTVLFHIHNLLLGGIEKVLLELLQSLDPDKYRVKLSIAHNLGDKEILRPQVPAHVEVRHLIDSPILSYANRKKMTGRISLPEKAIAELLLPVISKSVQSRQLKEFIRDVDVVVDFDMTLARYYRVLAGKRKVAYCHFSFPFYYDGNRRRLDKLAGRLSQFDRVVMLCDEMKAEVAEMYPGLAPKLVRIYNALDFGRIRTLAEERLTGYEHLQETGYYVSVGRLHAAQKDVHTVVRAYGLAVREHGVKEHLVIVGEGGAKEELRDLAHAEGVGERVHFVGFQENPYKWMARASLFLFGSKYEGLPTVLIEALSLGRTIIATACPTGVKEILMDGRAGMLVPVGDFVTMGHGIHQLMINDSQRQSYGEAAATILRQFDIRYMIGEFERIVIGD